MRLLFPLALLFYATITIAAPGVISPNIKIDQFGYRPDDPKIAVIAQPQSGYGAPSSYTPGTTFKVRRWSDDAEMFSGSIVAWNGGATHAQSGDKVWWFDFSNFQTPGEYYLYDPTNHVGSYQFSISASVYSNLLDMATKSLFYQRCGADITATHGGTWTHGVCHQGAQQDLVCRLVTSPGSSATEKDLSGGWHDAGDYNKYTNFTYTPLHQLLLAYEERPDRFSDGLNIPESGNGVPDVLDEVKYELDWLLKMQQADGSVLSKVSVTGYDAGSPPNTDIAPRYYGAASTSATLTVAGVFAHASRVLGAFPAYSTYANTLRTRAELAWSWAVANPSVTFSNTGFSSADPEVDAYERDARKTTAALMLYALTGGSTYKTWFESHYLDLHPVAWEYFYPFEKTYGDLALYAHFVSGISTAVKNDIKTRFTNSVNNQPDFFPAFTGANDAYRAYMKDDDYVWGTNEHKSWLGVMYGQMVRLNLSPANHAQYRKAAIGFLNYLHGVNPVGYAMPANSGAAGADHPVTEIYHGWTGDGTVFDNNPIPGLLPGGTNRYYSGSNTYFSGQPIQKCFLNFNSYWPENSWEITEPAIYYQAAYIRLLATVPDGNVVVVPVSLVEFSGSTDEVTRYNVLQWRTETERNVRTFVIERSTDGVKFEAIGQVAALGNSDGQQQYRFIDRHTGPNALYYRLKTIDNDDTFAYSNLLVLSRTSKRRIEVFPTVAQDVLYLVAAPELYEAKAIIVNAQGVVMKTVGLGAASIQVSDLPSGFYVLMVQGAKGAVEPVRFFKQ